jgi:glycosyltransferase involved in cell wall biosynthesis
MNSLSYPQYSAIIRTSASFPIVVDVIKALKGQSCPPKEIIIVDSKSTEEDRLKLGQMSDQLIIYPDEDFNFSKAINIGVERAKTDLVLIISSHVLMQDDRVMEQCFSYEGIWSESCIGACLYPSPSIAEGYKFRIMDRTNHSPYDGFSNSCAIIKKVYIDQRPFREEVFSAEDQEWAAYYLQRLNKCFIGISCSKLLYLNSRVNDIKKINEITSMAMYSFPELIKFKSLCKYFRLTIQSIRTGERRKFLLNFRILCELIMLRFRKIKRSSTYY